MILSFALRLFCVGLERAREPFLLFGLCKYGLRQAPKKCVEALRISLPLAWLAAMPGQLNLGLAAVAFISPQNHPILVRALSGSPDDHLKYHYIAHTSLDVIDERS